MIKLRRSNLFYKEGNGIIRHSRWRKHVSAIYAFYMKDENGWTNSLKKYMSTAIGNVSTTLGLRPCESEDDDLKATVSTRLHPYADWYASVLLACVLSFKALLSLLNMNCNFLLIIYMKNNYLFDFWLHLAYESISSSMYLLPISFAKREKKHLVKEMFDQL